MRKDQRTFQKWCCSGSWRNMQDNGRIFPRNLFMSCNPKNMQNGCTHNNNERQNNPNPTTMLHWRHCFKTDQILCLWAELSTDSGHSKQYSDSPLKRWGKTKHCPDMDKVVCGIFVLKLANKWHVWVKCGQQMSQRPHIYIGCCVGLGPRKHLTKSGVD